MQDERERDPVEMDPSTNTEATTELDTVATQFDTVATQFDTVAATPDPAPATPDPVPEGFPSPEELAAVDAHLDDVEAVLKSLDVDKGLEAHCAELAQQGQLDEHPALVAYWNAKTEAANRH